jgi:membrane protease YdiL (CAAX protease family)
MTAEGMPLPADATPVEEPDQSVDAGRSRRRRSDAAIPSRRERSVPHAGWMVVAGKEFADHLWSPRFLILLVILGLAALIPIAMLAVWAGHGWRPRWLTSVAPGLRWRWLLLCAAVGLVVTALSVLLPYALSGAPTGRGRQVAVLLAVVALTTPLQAAGEEYLFRGWLTQAIGSLFARAGLGTVVAGGISATLFAMAHGGQAPWLFLDRFAFGVLASYLTWRTGGLEAAIAVHTANNVVVFVPTILTGGLAGVLTVTDAPPAMVALDLAVMAVIALLITWLARRLRLQRVFVPPARPGAVLAPPTHLR